MVAEVKEIIQDYILLVYDIPRNSDKLRREILRKISEIGGTMYTESCYFLPYSDDAMALANEISSSGDVVVWRSTQENEHIAKKITLKYEDHLKARCMAIEQRLAMIQNHLDNQRLGKAHRMILKTHYLLEQLKQISENYQTDWLPEAIAVLEENLKGVYSK